MNRDLATAADLFERRIPAARGKVAELQAKLSEHVARAKEAGASWGEIADELGCSKIYAQNMMQVARDKLPPSKRRTG